MWLDPSPDGEVIRTPAVAFRREPAILPRMSMPVFRWREVGEEDRDEVASNANQYSDDSFYGVLVTSGLRFLTTPHGQLEITGSAATYCSGSKRWFF